MTTNDAPRIALWKILLPVALILLAVVLTLWVMKPKSRSTIALNPDGSAKVTHEGEALEPVVGVTLPDLDLDIFTGAHRKLSQTKAKVTIINFWATWCGACLVEMPSLLKLQKAYADQGLDLVAMSVDENASEVIPGFIQKMGFALPVYLDTDQKLSELFDIHAIPFTVVINHDRKILYTDAGERDWNSSEVHGWVDRWLAESK